MSDRVEDGAAGHNIVPAGVWQGTKLEDGGRWLQVSWRQNFDGKTLSSEIRVNY
jgi:hypothetical protein